ncbi:unnamed protein product [Linum tenue]|uniref:Replication protein A subunit n=1 Tax=Linum tenue TaxID=586396 RepID=A0AAV0HQU5_9ROSI|nr:unnamed protein product [Linum tenue]
MSINLTPNSIAAINGGDLNLKPLVQVLDIKQIGTSQERYRLLISDSVSTHHAMLATQLNDRVKTGRVKKGSVVQLIDYMCSDVQNRRIVVVLNMETIVLDCDIIGNPKLGDMTAQKTVSNLNSAQPGRSVYDNRGNIQSFRPAFNAQNPGSNNMQGLQTNPLLQSQGMQGSRPMLMVPNGSNGVLRSATGKNNNNTQTYAPTVQPAYQPPPSYRNQGPIMKNEAPARVIPISALNPYQGRWAIKARVTAKGDLRRYNNAKGDGKVFSFDLLDSDGGEIRATCFNAVVDRFYDVIEVGRVYLISKGGLKPAQKNFNHLKNEWEIFLEAASTVDLCPEEDGGSIPQQQFDFKPISEIESAENNSILDIIGIVISVKPSVPILRKNGMETQRRTVGMKDSSGRSVELTLWGDFCNKEGQNLQELVDSEMFPVLAVKAGKVSDFTGKSVGTISSTQLFINPDIPEAHVLSDWFARIGQNSAAVSISRDVVPSGSKNEIRKTVSQIKEEGLGRSDKPDWVTVKATITYFKLDSFCYPACPLMIGDRQCNKKATRSGTRWVCDRCSQEFDECDYRYLLQFQIQDHTGLAWVTAFQESGEEIMGYPAKEVYQLKHEAQDEARLSDVFRSRVFYPYLFRLKIKEEMYADETKVKITVVRADKIDYSSETRHMLDTISRFRRY